MSETQFRVLKEVVSDADMRAAGISEMYLDCPNPVWDDKGVIASETSYVNPQQLGELFGEGRFLVWEAGDDTFDFKFTRVQDITIAVDKPSFTEVRGVSGATHPLQQYREAHPQAGNTGANPQPETDPAAVDELVEALHPIV